MPGWYKVGCSNSLWASQMKSPASFRFRISPPAHHQPRFNNFSKPVHRLDFLDFFTSSPRDDRSISRQFSFFSFWEPQSRLSATIDSRQLFSNPSGGLRRGRATRVHTYPSYNSRQLRNTKNNNSPKATTPEIQTHSPKKDPPHHFGP